ncbi:hypothetical protein Tco_1530580 [Tanacetum coccineum]
MDSYFGIFALKLDVSFAAYSKRGLLADLMPELITFVISGTLLTSTILGGVHISGMLMVETACILLTSTALVRVGISRMLMVDIATDGSLGPGIMARVLLSQPNLKQIIAVKFSEQIITFWYAKAVRFRIKASQRRTC